MLFRSATQGRVRCHTVRLRIRLCLLPVFLVPAALALAQDAFDEQFSKCDEASAPMRTIDTTWEQMSVAGDNLPFGCFDGYFGEGISDTLVRKLSTEWTGLFPAVPRRNHKNGFTKILLESISSVAELTELKTVFELSRVSCPATWEALCKEINHRAKTAIETYQDAEK